MLSTSSPAKTSVPFGNGGSRNVIPVPSQIGITPGAASFTDGFPPLTYTDPTAGGIAPAAQDFNGILYEITLAQQWQQAGGLPGFDSAFSTAVGGYPKGSVLQSADLSGMWVSTADNNTANPDTGGAGWMPMFFFGNALQTAAGTAITLTQVQAAKPMIIVSGTLTANVAITFPSWIARWLVVNNTSGAFTLTAKTATGTAVTLIAGSNYLYGDGSNILAAGFLTAQSFAAAQSLATNGYQTLPGGRIEQWGTTAVPSGSNVATTTITFPIPFTSAIFGVVGNADKAASSAWNPVTVNFTAQTLISTVMVCDTANSGISFQSGINVHWRAIGK